MAPATRKVPASMRSGMTVCSAPCSSFDALECGSGWCRRPRSSRPSALRKLARSTTSGSAAAPSMTVCPSASTAAIITLSVPSTVEPCFPRMSMTAPRSPRLAERLDVAGLDAQPGRRAPRIRAGAGRSVGRRSRIRPGSDTGASFMRASSGPITQTEARILRTRS